jgi:AraC-like DNA-binding protein
LKPVLENIVPEKQRSVVAYEHVVPSFEFKWHFHPEYELTYIVSGNGYRLVGDHSEPFTAGDFVLLGPNVPHTWVSDATSVKNIAYVIQFTERVARPNNLPEWDFLKPLFKAATRGVAFKTDEAIVESLKFIVTQSGVTQLTALWNLLNTLSNTEINSLASTRYQVNFNQKSASRLNKAFNFIHQNALDAITLEQIADEVNMTPSSFSRFFKKMSGKTFIGYVNEFRIRQACHYLINTDSPIPDVAFNAGFGSITHFNRIFLQLMKLPPLAYRRQFLTITL